MLGSAVIVIPTAAITMNTQTGTSIHYRKAGIEGEHGRFSALIAFRRNGVFIQDHAARSAHSKMAEIVLLTVPKPTARPWPGLSTIGFRVSIGSGGKSPWLEA